VLGSSRRSQLCAPVCHWPRRTRAAAGRLVRPQSAAAACRELREISAAPVEGSSQRRRWPRLEGLAASGLLRRATLRRRVVQPSAMLNCATPRPVARERPPMTYPAHRSCVGFLLGEGEPTGVSAQRVEPSRYEARSRSRSERSHHARLLSGPSCTRSASESSASRRSERRTGPG
jgi:hypothetical protein